jgi:hypothetical protein
MSDIRPILGHDRNGREVRKGDRIRHYSNSIPDIVVAKTSNGTSGHPCLFIDELGARGFHFTETELVTDEKAEPAKCTAHGRPWCKNKNCRHEVEPERLTDAELEQARKELQRPDVREAIDIANGLHATALESFTRWLANPTLAERYAAFRARLTKLMECAPLVKFDFDCDAENGMQLRLRRPREVPNRGDDWVCFLPRGLSDEAFDRMVVAQLNNWATDIGREVLRGRKALAK